MIFYHLSALKLQREGARKQALSTDIAMYSQMIRCVSNTHKE